MDMYYWLPAVQDTIKTELSPYLLTIIVIRFIRTVFDSFVRMYDGKCCFLNILQ